MLILQPKFGGKIIDIVSGDIDTPEQKSEALKEVTNTIVYITSIVLVGYDYLDLLTLRHSVWSHCLVYKIAMGLCLANLKPDRRGA